MIAAGITLPELDGKCTKLQAAWQKECHADVRKYDAVVNGEDGVDPNFNDKDKPKESAAQDAWSHLKLLMAGKADEAYGKSKGAGCPEGQEMKGSKCVDKKEAFNCPPGQVFKDEKCVDNSSAWKGPEGGFVDINIVGDAGGVKSSDGLSSAPSTGGGDYGPDEDAAGVGVRAGYGFMPDPNWLLRVYAGLDGMFFKQQYSNGIGHRPGPGGQVYAGFEPSYLFKTSENTRLGLGVPLEIGYNWTQHDIYGNGPGRMQMNYGFLRFGAAATFYIAVSNHVSLELGLKYLYTPEFADKFGRSDQDYSSDTSAHGTILQHNVTGILGVTF